MPNDRFCKYTIEVGGNMPPICIFDLQLKAVIIVLMHHFRPTLCTLGPQYALLSHNINCLT